jgi:hypothetical protein
VGDRLESEHPSWCEGGGRRCGTHLGAPVDVAATAGRFVADDCGALFPRVEVAAAETAAGVEAVHLAVFDPTGRSEPRWAAALLTCGEVRALLTRLAECLDIAEGAPARRTTCSLRIADAELSEAAG